MDGLVTPAELQAELDEYSNEESDTNTRLSTKGLKRLACYSHKLQLILTHFDMFRKKKTVTRGNGNRGAIRGGRSRGRGCQSNRTNGEPQLPYFAEVINKAQKLVAAFNKSGYAVTTLLKKTSKKLCADVSTSKYRITKATVTYMNIYLFLRVVVFLFDVGTSS